MIRNNKNDLLESYPIIISWMWIRSSIMVMNLLLGVVVLLLRRMMLSVIGWQTDGHSMLIADGQISHFENVLNTSFWKTSLGVKVMWVVPFSFTWIFFSFLKNCEILILLLWNSRFYIGIYA